MTDMPDFRFLADSLIPVVRKAGFAIMGIYESDFAVLQKDDDSPVTAADRVAEDILVPALRDLTPDFPVVAEEAVAAGDCPSVGSGPFWLVDPLDGTKEFVRRNGEFTVNVGLVSGQYPVFGIVYLPVLDVLYLGCGSGGAFRYTGDGLPERLQCRAPGAEGLTVLSSRSHAKGDALSAWLADKVVAGIVHAGSSLKFCRLAEGTADVYPRFGPTSEWDTCAGHAVLLAAGGRMTCLDGAPFVYGKPGFGNPGFIASGL